MPVTLSMLDSTPRSSAPPPARQIPEIMMSASSSGGVDSRAVFTQLRISDTTGVIASRIWPLETSKERGRRVARSRPRTTAVPSPSKGSVEPTSILQASAERSPMSSPCSARM